MHDFLAFTWHEPERTEVLGLLSSWVDRNQMDRMGEFDPCAIPWVLSVRV